VHKTREVFGTADDQLRFESNLKNTSAQYCRYIYPYGDLNVISCSVKDEFVRETRSQKCGIKRDGKRNNTVTKGSKNKTTERMKK